MAKIATRTIIVVFSRESYFSLAGITSILTLISAYFS